MGSYSGHYTMNAFKVGFLKRAYSIHFLLLKSHNDIIL